MTRENAVRSILKSHPDTPTRTLAKILSSKYPTLFSNLESARNSIRYARGAFGDSHRADAVKAGTDTDFRPKGSQSDRPSESDENEKAAAESLEAAILRIMGRNLRKNQGASVGDLSDELDRSQASIKKAVANLVEQGYNIALNPEEEVELATSIPKKEVLSINTEDHFGDDWIRFGFVTDTHSCSNYHRPDVLNALYDIYEREGIRTVYHGGNWIDGEANFNKYEVNCIGVENQIDHFVKTYPIRKNIVTQFISGDDHEGWYVQRNQINVGRTMQDRAEDAGRKDLIDLGYMERDIEFKREGGSAIVRVIHAGGGCFTEGAEILTRNAGWKLFKDLCFEDSVATMNKETGQFEWQSPQQITNQPYSGDVYRFKHRVFDFTVTPEHGLWVRNYRSVWTAKQPKRIPQKGHNKKRTDWHRIDARCVAEAFGRQSLQMKTACSGWVGEYTEYVEVPRLEPKNPGNLRNVSQMQHIGKIRMEDAAELIAWFVTEGSAHKKGISISQSQRVNRTLHSQICKLLDRIGVRYRISGRDNKDISIGSKEISAWLVSQCSNGSRNKFLPTWLKNQPAKILRIVFDTMINGDGWFNGESFGYKSISLKLRSDLSEVAQKLGYGVVFNKDSVCCRSVQNEPTINNPPVKSFYTGNIYCCTVPNGLIFVRMNGKAFWSHNSSYATSYTSQKYTESLQSGEKPKMVLIGHYHKFDWAYPREVHTVQGGTVQDQTSFMRKHKIQAMVGGCLVEIKQDKQGCFVRVRVEWMPFYDKKFYEYKWK